MTTIPPSPEEALVTISTPESDTVRVRDRVESSRFEFYFDEDVEIEETPTDDTYFPVDVAARFSGDWSKIIFPMSSGVFIHDHHTGEVIQRIGQDNRETELEAGAYEMELIPSPVKIYVVVKSATTVTLVEDQICITTGSCEDVMTGVRSNHEHPAGTITTTTDVGDVMRAVSNLGSALKTTSPERSWPTLRGQPPNIELGESLDVPSSITRHNVDVKLEIPYNLKSVFNVAPLAYYTSAEVVPLPSNSDTPALVAAGTRIPLNGNLSTAAATLLQRNVLLDSVIRSAGIYPFITVERESLEASISGEFEDIYSLPLAERIVAYQDVPQEALEEVWPSWPLTIDVDGSMDDIPAIPHIAEELAVVRVPEPELNSPTPQPAYVRDFVRADGSGATGTERTTGDGDRISNISTPIEWDTQIHTSLRDSYPIGSNKTTVRAYERHLEREAPDTDEIQVNVVCNDDDMREEDVVTELYGVRDLLEFDVNVYYTLTCEEFKTLLSDSFDLIHYIGHVDESGIKCEDGYVDIRTDVSEVNFDAFLLNACRSVEQGEALLDAGAVGGIATLYDVPNSSATILGRTLSRLLNRGFTIRAALEIARESSYLGNRWVSMGDGRVSLTQPESGVTAMAEVTPVKDGFELGLEFFETVYYRIGTIVTPNAEWNESHVMPGRMQRKISLEELEEFFALEVQPIRCGNGLYWTDEVSPEELRKQHRT